jgi:hypothetical protein
MSDKPLRTSESTGPDLQARVGRVLFFISGGLLLGILVSCACGPVR